MLNIHKVDRARHEGEKLHHISYRHAHHALDLYRQSVEDRFHQEMSSHRLSVASIALLLLSALCPSGYAQDDRDAKAHTGKSDPTSRVTIEVKGGDKDTPVENASIYLKYVEERKLKKDRNVELNVKTNREGIAHIPEAPTGRVLIQIVAEGWKTYGRWFDITEAKQTIKIRLEKPPRWY